MRLAFRSGDPEVVQFLKSWIAGKSRQAKLWPGNWATSRGGGKMIRAVLEAAEISYEVDDRKADFHALRYTFITNLIKAGEPPAYVQRLARHSDINLTYRVYTLDLGLEDLWSWYAAKWSGIDTIRKRD
ncbi:MAG: tyrosine-type recombinase/integrase [Planctomycetaceae bacterium]